jgi:hypothetical protein
MNTYNGWTNYATWRINLEWFDGVDDVFIDAYKGDDVHDFADNLRSYVEDALDQQSNHDMVLSYALAFIQDVNWHEIAQHLADEHYEG